MKRIITLLAACALLFTAGCTGKLASGGFYADKQVLYVTDQTFESAHDTLDEVFLWEYENREALKTLLPDLKPRLDALRVEADAYLKRYAGARRAYLLTPTPETQTTLDAVLRELQRLANVALTLKPTNP